MNLLARIALASSILMLPALLICTCGVLYSVFGVTAANDFGTLVMRKAGKVFSSPIVVLGGVLISGALNLWAACRVCAGFDTSTVYVTLYIRRALGPLLLAGLALLLMGTMLLYAFVENFRVIAR